MVNGYSFLYDMTYISSNKPTSAGGVFRNGEPLSYHGLASYTETNFNSMPIIKAIVHKRIRPKATISNGYKRFKDKFNVRGGIRRIWRPVVSRPSTIKVHTKNQGRGFGRIWSKASRSKVHTGKTSKTCRIETG